MANNDNLAGCLSKLNNSEKAAKREVLISVNSKMIKQILDIFKKHDYISDVKEQGKNASMILLNDQINQCGAIKPRFKVKSDEIERFEQRYLPAKGFGLLIISTSKGLLTNQEAKEKKVGGRLIAYCY